MRQKLIDHRFHVRIRRIEIRDPSQRALVAALLG
jgi:hypothetical protein